MQAIQHHSADLRQSREMEQNELTSSAGWGRSHRKWNDVLCWMNTSTRLSTSMLLTSALYKSDSTQTGTSTFRSVILTGRNSSSHHRMFASQRGARYSKWSNIQGSESCYSPVPAPWDVGTYPLKSHWRWGLLQTSKRHTVLARNAEWNKILCK